MKIFVIISFVIMASTAMAEDYYYPKTDIFSVSSGIYYDNPNKINSYLTNSNKPAILPEHVYYFGLNYKVNHNPIISNKPYFLLYSLDIKFPLTRKVSNEKFNTELQSYSISAEVSTFESYLKTVTVHPVLGFGISKTELIITNKRDNLIAETNGVTTAYKFEKYSAIFNIGGGCDLRIKLRETENETKNVIFSFEAKYSISLDALDLFKSIWRIGNVDAEAIPDYTPPGLSIELKIGIENQRE